MHTASIKIYNSNTKWDHSLCVKKHNLSTPYVLGNTDTTSSHGTTRSLITHLFMRIPRHRCLLRMTPFFHDQFDFDLLITGYARIHGGIDMIDFAPRIQTIMNSYYPRPSITCSKHEIIDENMVEFWELSSFDHAFWSFCAKQIVGIAFVVDLSCFDEFHYDSATYTKKQNKMSQTLANFRQMIQHKAVTNCNNTAFFVILNKTDAFKEKLSRGTSIKICPEFQGYEGADFDYNQCIAHIKDVFDEMNNASERLVYFHETCAVAKTGSDLNGLGVIPEDSSSDKIQKIWHKFGVNLNYHWNLLHS
eukprot:106208_1